MTVHYSMNLNNLTDTYDTDKIENASYLSNYEVFFSELAQVSYGVCSGGAKFTSRTYGAHSVKLRAL